MIAAASPVDSHVCYKNKLEEKKWNWSVHLSGSMVDQSVFAVMNILFQNDCKQLQVNIPPFRQRCIVSKYSPGGYLAFNVLTKAET